MCKRFILERIKDISGISGVGKVAEGVKFSDGSVAVRWISAVPSTVIWESVEAAMSVHGHNGGTRIIWADDPITESDHCEMCHSDILCMDHAACPACLSGVTSDVP